MDTASRDLSKPATMPEYAAWLQREHNVEPIDRIRTRYSAVVAKLRDEFAGSAYWQEVLAMLPNVEADYRLQASDYPLLLSKPSELEVVMKPFESFLGKTYRRNVLDNATWPDPPEGGWLLPDDWYSKLHDLVRTTIVVRYLDGVAFVGDALSGLAARCDVACALAYEARMEGYYAGHLNTTHEFPIPGRDWDTKRIPVTIEIQITTQLQAVIKRLTHRYYEARRLAEPSARGVWPWEYQSDQFVANYLGHILHYVEGMIMEVRDRQSTGNSSLPERSPFV